MKTEPFLLYFLGVILLFANGCTRSQPIISHAHLGHALTAWHDTPGKKGLLEVSKSDASNAWKELRLAKSSADMSPAVSTHLDNIIHSLNPQLKYLGTGSGYGVVPAIQAVVEHVNFAADSKDASVNIVVSTETFNQYAAETVDKFLLALAQARLIATLDSLQIADQLPDLENSLLQAIAGVDIDRDGIIGNLPEESGLRQLEKMLNDMAANEVDPPYAPVARRYLLGMFRLPNGHWGFDRGSSY